MRSGPHLGQTLPAAVVASVLWLGCQGPPGRVEPGSVSRAEEEVEAEPEQPEPVEPEPAVPGEDALLAEARSSIAGGQLSAESRRRLAESERPEHRRATRLLQAVAREQPSPLVAPPPPEPAPAPEPAPTPEPTPTPVPEATEEEVENDELDPRRFPVESAVGSWFAGEVAIESAEIPLHDPFAGLLAVDEPGVLLPIDLATAQPRVILTRLDLARLDTGALQLQIVGAGAVAVRVQPLDAHRLRVRIDDAGAVPGFVAARPSQPELAVTAVRRGRGCVEVDLELASDWDLALARTRTNGADLEFTPAM